MSTIAISPRFTVKTASRSFKSSRSRFYTGAFAAAGAAAAAAGTFYYSRRNERGSSGSNGPSGSGGPSGPSGPLKSLFGFGSASASSALATNVREAAAEVKPAETYQSIYNDIALKLRDEDEFDDGSYGPILVRLAWHSSGSYNKDDNSETKGGSYGATMRYEREKKDPENAGLKTAIEFLDSIKAKHPEISYGDLWTLGGVCAIQELNGPKIKWRPGRVDLGENAVPPYHRLPDASQETGEYVRSVFNGRLGFTDKEMVCLIGVGHALGRCHTYNSGFDGPWTFSPTMVTNDFFKLLLSEDWQIKQWDGKRQYTDAATKSLMMLPTDMVLKKDSKFRQYVEEYAKDEEKCMRDFADVFARLIELGVKFPPTTKPIVFKTLEEQGI